MIRATILTLTLLLSLPLSARAADLLIAQAANFMPAMQEIIPAFEKATGIKAEATFASTGKLYAQITNGSPHDIFLAADQKRPDKLHVAGLAEKPFVYALGKVVLWSSKPGLCNRPWHEAAMSASASKIAIANTETAPYGTSAMKALQKAGIWDDIQPKLVHGQSIAQAFQYAHTGAADAGFCAYSSVFTEQGRKGCFSVVEEAPRVVQAACLLKNAPHPEAAQKFIKFLSGPEAKAIKTKYGYE
ncbi:molybdate ABC transporter substrate-binding protein [Desulfovibrio ferrophilus]|uniref:Molybdenum ABC transporter periplasmic molybdate-binding protein n=1 Tax=Desulfovibrio ferrophilus TaxID=241368 RepID=A0A2Z6AY75_9BACT|nr:molybdate ABC transporter substrate-binding protein [Desulfovibrio ferrophilus]BBD08222.1 molybdenum ABC transporter periplasmic molybdate-binding protein [Desulfovibrio ferrophilus]